VKKVSLFYLPEMKPSIENCLTIENKIDNSSQENEIQEQKITDYEQSFYRS
jgi:hypothetical protein